MKKILVLGATGSIGTSALDIIKNHGDLFCLSGMSAHKSAEKLIALSREFDCKNTCLSDDCAPKSGEIAFYGDRGLKRLITESDADIVLNGIAGAAGLMPSIYALECGKDLALANKETIVMAGILIKALAQKNGARILPVDSEHSAVFSLMNRYGADSVESVILTASGGPFRTLEAKELSRVTLADTLKHPTWNMGQKITIDSATLANKGLEVIEACRLFDMQPRNVRVVIHPQSLIHSLIQTKDGVLYAQISHPDMRHPILQALSWPEFIPNNLTQFDITLGGEMTFFPPRPDDFKMLSLAYEATAKSGAYTIAYNAANEVAVDAFVHGACGFTDIPRITEAVLQNDWGTEPKDFAEVFMFDKTARQKAKEIASKL